MPVIQLPVRRLDVDEVDDRDGRDDLDATPDLPAPGDFEGRSGKRRALRKLAAAAERLRETRMRITRIGPAPRSASEALLDDAGAATAEYAIATMAAVAFAGLLVVIMQSDEVRGMLEDLVRDALSYNG